MTLRSYFGEQNSTLGSVVPLAMFLIMSFVASSFQVCPIDSFGTPPPQVITPSGDVLIGESNHNYNPEI